MRLLVDMNLSPEWVTFLNNAGHDAVHWSTAGDVRAGDIEIMAWARESGRAVFTHDLGFGTTLALTRGVGPSVIQVRTQNIIPQAVGKMVLAALEQFRDQLERGAIVVVDETRQRIRALPLK